MNVAFDFSHIPEDAFAFCLRSGTLLDMSTAVIKRTDSETMDGYQNSPFSLPIENAIFGVQFKNLKTNSDPRGFFREVIRTSDPLFMGGVFGQWSHSKMQQNVVKAWHYHHVQTDWWYTPIGKMQTVLYDNRAESPTYKTKLIFNMGDSAEFGTDTNEVCVRIPPGVLHGCKVLSTTAHLFYITSITYDPNEEGRFPFNSPLVGHEWGAEALTVENDRREFVPTSIRVPVV